MDATESVFDRSLLMEAEPRGERAVKQNHAEYFADSSDAPISVLRRRMVQQGLRNESSEGRLSRPDPCTLDASLPQERFIVSTAPGTSRGTPSQNPLPFINDSSTDGIRCNEPNAQSIIPNSSELTIRQSIYSFPSELTTHSAGQTLPTVIQVPNEISKSRSPDAKRRKSSSHVDIIAFPSTEARIVVKNPLSRWGSSADSSLEAAAASSSISMLNGALLDKDPKDVVPLIKVAEEVCCGGPSAVATPEMVAEKEEGVEEEKAAIYGLHPSRSFADDDDASSVARPESFVCCTLSSLPAVAFFMCTCAVMVGLIGFLPFYFSGVTANSKTTEFLLSEAMKGVATITENSVSMLPAFVYIITFNYIKRQRTTLNETNLPSDPDDLLTSLLTVLTRFTPSIRFLRFFYNGGLYTNAVYSSNFSTPYGGAASTPVTVPLLAVYSTNVTIVEPPQILTNFSFGNEIQRSGGPMKRIVEPWASEEQSERRWLPNSDNTTGIYFDYVMPFSTDGVLGYCEAGLPTQRIIEDAYTLTPFLRDHGHFFIMDANRDLLLEDSWNQTTSAYSLAGGAFQPFKLYEINEPIIITAMAALNTSGGLATVMANSTSTLVQFKYNNNNAYLNLTKLTDNYGLDIVLGVVVLRADFEKAFAKARTVVITVTVAVVVVAGIMAVVIACCVVNELKRLTPQLVRASNLEVSHSKSKDHKSRGLIFYITEIRSIHDAFLKLERSLKEMKSFVPQAVLVQAHSDSTFSDSDDSEDGNRPIRTKFNRNIVNESINEFSRMDVAIVLVDLHCYLNVADSRLIIDVVSQKAEEFNGYIESVGSSSFFVNFGPQWQNPQVVSKMCHFAIAVHSTVPAYLRKALVCFAVRMPFLLGTCGIKNSKCRVVFDTQRVLDVARILWDIDCHIASTTETLSHVAASTNMRWFQIDCVRFPNEAAPITLCELQDPNDPHPDESFLAKKMGDGLSKMCKGEYRAALQILDSVQSSDVQLHRLRQICIDRISCGCTERYVFLITDVYSFQGSCLRSTGEVDSHEHLSGAVASTVPSNDRAPSVAAAIMESSSPCQPNSLMGQRSTSVHSKSGFGNISLLVHPRNAAEVKKPITSTEPLPETLNFTEATIEKALGPRLSTSAVAVDDAQTKASNTLSLLSNAFVFNPSVTSAEVEVVQPCVDLSLGCLRDVNKHEWQISREPIGSGAFSMVYLGLSVEGQQVAIKTIPRLRRDIKEEEMELEVRTYAMLRHPNIVPYISCCVTPYHLAIVMEYVPGGSLHQVLESFGRLQRGIARRFMLDIVRGLAYLHESTTHGDVKPHNILLGMGGVCKLSDFGTATDKFNKASGPDEDRLLRGTAVYVSPEGARGEPLTSASDIFSLGISFLEMLLCRLPWRWFDRNTRTPLPLRNDREFLRRLIAGTIVVDIPEDLDSDVRELALACCAEDPAKRPSAQELLSYSFLI